MNAEVLLVSAACLISHKMWAALLGWKMLNSTFSLGHISALEIALDDLLATEDLDSYFVPRSYLTGLSEATDQN